MKRVNQSEIARASGVSVSTVSRVLSRAPGISAPVRDRVMSIAREMGYKIQLPGMVPGTAVSRVVLFVGPFQTPTGMSLVYSAILAGIRSAAESSGIAVTFALQDGEGNLPKHLLSDSGAGFLFLGVDPEPQVLRALHARKVPIVLVNGLDPEMIADAVSPANFSGGRLAARHLIEKGHRKIVQLTNLQRWTLRRRSQGLISGIREFSGGDGAADVRTVELDSLNEASVFRTVKQLLAHIEAGCTAAFCGNDLVGLATLQALKAHGYSVPGDIAVIGFDDLPVAEMADPALTTINIDWEAIGAEAMRLVTQRQADFTAPARHIQIGARLVQRQST
ncbi:MAG: LacI family DNA-binding transcriptional regulator [Tropicimonas sp.]|uniref:LacI family DNA-binding transcriptional regulator n=1 Tax=Tropicimonas sp. TaxID=2067044 RepID=UPI003A8981D2